MYLYALRKIKTEWIANPKLLFSLSFSAMLFISLLLQCILGNIDLRFFSYPMNLIVGLGMLYALIAGRNKWWVRKCGTLDMSLFAMSAVGFCGLVLGLFPQLSPQDASARNVVADMIGFYQLTTSYPFLFSLLFFLWVLGCVIFNRLKKISVSNVGFALAHFGLWLSVFSATLGSADTYKVKLAAYRHEATDLAFEQSGSSLHLPYKIRLQDFDVIRSGWKSTEDPGYIQNYNATISICREEVEQQHLLRVNHPIRFNGDRIYLSGYDVKAAENTRYCIIQVVRQPWEYLIFIGIVLMIGGFVYLFFTGFRAKKTEDELE